jgi:hypothetical protein
VIKVLFLTVVLVIISVIGLAFNLIFRKHDFPETHVGHNKEMKKKGISCVKTFDKLEQQKAWKKDRFSKLVLDKRK